MESSFDVKNVKERLSFLTTDGTVSAIGETASIYLSGVLEHLTKIVLEDTVRGMSSRSNTSNRIEQSDIIQALTSNAEISSLLKSLQTERKTPLQSLEGVVVSIEGSCHSGKTRLSESLISALQNMEKRSPARQTSSSKRPAPQSLSHANASQLEEAIKSSMSSLSSKARKRSRESPRRVAAGSDAIPPPPPDTPTSDSDGAVLLPPLSAASSSSSSDSSHRRAKRRKVESAAESLEDDDSTANIDAQEVTDSVVAECLLPEALDLPLVVQFYTDPLRFAFGHLMYVMTTSSMVLKNAQNRSAFALSDRGPLSILAIAMQTRDQGLVGDVQLKTFMKAHDKTFRALMQPSYMRGSLGDKTPTRKGSSRRKRNVTLFLDSDPEAVYKSVSSTFIRNALPPTFFEGLDDVLFELVLQQAARSKNVMFVPSFVPSFEQVCNRLVEIANGTRVCPTVVLDVATEPHNRFQYKIPEGAIAYRSQKDLKEAYSILKRQKFRPMWDAQASSNENSHQNKFSLSELKKSHRQPSVYIDINLWMQPRDAFKRVVLSHLMQFQTVCFFGALGRRAKDHPVVLWLTDG